MKKASEDPQLTYGELVFSWCGIRSLQYLFSICSVQWPLGVDFVVFRRAVQACKMCVTVVRAFTRMRVLGSDHARMQSRAKHVGVQHVWVWYDNCIFDNGAVG